ncbi:PTS fructose transporter subunit IIB [Natrialba sp. PRR66]|uniref:PTS fructose transporter subunit IIB n=1 Tax=Natrialba sp. PRR66 TaxID=3098146 RepID=UPI002B1E0878|nr:PTS fructose transporter subunit IIB [Natrialba sp. PRR66]
MKLIAVTSCPTGIAHSQMAAENLETTAEDRGHDIKVEVQGAMGAENELTETDIQTADAAIIAADTAVSQDRFTDMVLIKSTVKEAVNDAGGLIDQAVQQAEAGETGVTAVGSEGGVTTESEPGQESATSATAESTEQLGGDPSKGLFARLKRLFS